jgi:CPA1 family monovalent cation:H+ antiporter
VFILESVVFGLIGLQLPTLVHRLSGAEQAWPLQALAITVTLLIVRVLWVFPLAALTNRQDERRLSWQVPAVVSWAGARGVVPLAASLSIPFTLGDGTPLPHRDLVLLLTTAVIVTTLVVQGFTLAPLVRWTGVSLTVVHLHREHTDARSQLTRSALAYLDDVENSESAPQFAIEQLRHSWKLRLHRIETADPGDTADATPAVAYRRLRRDLLAAEAVELGRMYEAGVITDNTRRRIQRKLDLEQAGLDDENS